jgi:hypothetical protein
MSDAKKQTGSGGACAKTAASISRMGKLWANLSWSPSQLWKAIKESSVAVLDFQEQNITNWRILTGKSKSGKKISLPLSLRLRTDWGVNKNVPFEWVPLEMLWHHTCDVYDHKGEMHNISFTFNLDVLVNQSIAFTTMKRLEKELQAQFPAQWNNPVTQNPWTPEEIEQISGAYRRALQQIENNKSLFRKALAIAPHLATAGKLALTMGPAAVGYMYGSPVDIGDWSNTIITLYALTWALPLVNAGLEQADRYYHKYDDMTGEEKRDLIGFLDVGVALAGAATSNSKHTVSEWFDSGLFGLGAKNLLPYGEYYQYILLSSVFVGLGGNFLITKLRNDYLENDALFENRFDKIKAIQNNNLDAERVNIIGKATNVDDAYTNAMTYFAQKAKIQTQTGPQAGGRRRRSRSQRRRRSRSRTQRRRSRSRTQRRRSRSRTQRRRSRSQRRRS